MKRQKPKQSEDSSKSIGLSSEQYAKIETRMNRFATILLFIFVMFLMSFLNTSCGADESKDIVPVESIEEQEEVLNYDDDPDTVMLCQYAEACDGQGNCFFNDEPIEFEINEALIVYIACFNFEQCSLEEPPLFSDARIQSFKNICPNRER